MTSRIHAFYVVTKLKLSNLLDNLYKVHLVFKELFIMLWKQQEISKGNYKNFP